MKKSGPKQDGVLDAELTELQVQITSSNPECDGYPSLKTDESCELPFFRHAFLPHVKLMGGGDDT